MKFSTFSLSQVSDQKRTVEILDGQFDLFILAEKLGFSTVWLAEHLFSTHGTFASTQILAGAIARCTKTIRIGTAVNVVAFNHPLRTASDFAAVDCMSHGRLNYGVGRAYQQAEFDALGLSMKDSRGLYNEALDIILKAWSGESFSYDGKFWKIPNPVKVYPELVQKPHPPIYLAAQSRDSFVDAGRRGVNLLMSAGFAWHDLGKGWIDGMETKLLAFEQAARENGHDPKKAERALMISGHVAESRDLAERTYGPCLDWALGQHASRSHKDGSLKSFAENPPPLSDWNFQGLKSGNACIVDDPDGAARQIMSLRDRLGLTEIIVEFDRGGLPRDQVAKSMRLWMERVAPRFADAGAVPSMEAAS